MNSIIIACLLIAALAALTDAQSCISPRGFEPNVCEFTPSSSFFNDATQSTGNKCSTTNDNPFSSFPPAANAPQNQAMCNAAIQADGTDCINAYAKFQCANRCSLCNQDPCKSLCTTLSAECPTALNQNCFQFALCATSDSNCVNWDIDTSKLPTFTTASTTASTTTSSSSSSTASTTTGTGSTTQSSTTTSTSGGSGQAVTTAATMLVFLIVLFLNLV